MTSLHLELQCCAPVSGSFFSWCISFYGCDVSFPTPIAGFFNAQGKASLVCALLPQLDSLEAFYHRLIGNEPGKQCPEDMLLLQQTFPLLFDIVSIVEGDHLPETLTALIIDLLEKVKSLFGRNGSIPDAVQLDVHRTNDVEYYPCLPVVRSRSDYCLDDTTPNIYKKRSTRHPSLLPGVFLVHCKQGITYGFSVMLCNESPNIPFTVFQMHFSQGPRLIVYDDACNLHSYCLNQDPVFFKNSQFLVDQLHWQDHTVNSDMCRLCFQGPDEEIFGKFFKDINTGFSVHQYCMFLSSGLAQRGKDDEEFDGFLIKDIKKEISRAKRLRCSFCRKLGASIGCCEGGCRETFHYKCGKENGALFQFFDTFNSFCRHHRPTQDVALKRNQTCPICLCEIEQKNKSPVYDIPLVTPCCRRTWFHNKCLQKHAKSSGLYYFRCPVCNNLEEFQEEMKQMGIFIPDQDASWETEGAFVDLLFQYSRCDAKNCVCPNGREYKETSGKWRLRLCDTCGQTGTHLKCQRWKKSPGEWHCHVCGHSEPQLSTRQRQIGDHSMNYLSHDDDDDAWESPTEDCEVNVCSVSDDEPPLAEIRNELNCRRETPLPEDTVVKKPNMGSSPMRKRLRISLQRSDDEDETIEQKGERTIELQETPDFSSLHLGDSSSSMTSSVLLTLSGLITESARENLQNELELIGKESIESDCSSDASVEFVKAVKTDKEHFDSEANVDRSAPVLPNTRSAQCGKVPRRACFREVKQDLSSTTSKAVMDFVEAESCIISVRTEGRESTSVVNFSVAENKEDSDEDSCCITKVVRKLCPFGNDKCGLKCDLDCCNSVVRHIYQSPSPSAVSMGSYVHKDLQSKTFDSSSTCGSTSHVKGNKGKPVDKNKLFDTTTTEAVEEDRASFISVGTNTLPFKPCVKKDSLHKVALDAATTQRKRIKLSTKKSSKRLKRFAAVQDEKVALSHKC